MPMTPLEELTAIIVKAVDSANKPYHYIAHDGKIWLDDVLRALQPIRSVRHGWLEVTPWGRINHYYNEEYDIETDEITRSAEWAIGKPLSEQSEELWNFLLSLLKV